VPKRVEKINDYLFIDKSNEIQIGMNEIRVNDGEINMRCNNILVNTRDISYGQLLNKTASTRISFWLLTVKVHT